MFSSLLRTLFPRRCAGCRKPRIALCSTCLAKVRRAIDLPDDTFALYDYAHVIVRSGIRELKYHRRSEVAQTLAIVGIAEIHEFLAQSLQSTGLERFVIVPIPEHPHKLRAKGFNQSILLARWWQAHLSGSRVSPVLEKSVFTLPQARLGRSARLSNVKDSMRAAQILDPQVIYLVVDDVTTTGATFVEAKRALRAGGAKKILCIALAHGYAKK